jgi:hypothetical protein
MKFVRSSTDVVKQNLEVFQHEEKIYFRTTTDIAPSVELLMASDHHLKYTIYGGDGTLSYYVPYNVNDGVCPVCEQNLGTATAVRTHPLFHEGVCPHDCLTCGACFRTIKEQKHHKRVEHPEVAPFLCQNCDGWFSTTGGLVRHSAVHTNILRCSVCGKHFQAMSEMRIHMYNEHSLSVKHYCDVCQLQFPNSAKLLKHAEKHQQMQFRCIKCRMSFTGFNELMAHRKIHRIYKTKMPKSIKKEEGVTVKQEPQVTIKQEAS